MGINSLVRTLVDTDNLETMKSALVPALIGTVCLTLLTACGSGKSIVTGEFEEEYEGASVTVNYYSPALEERVVVGSGTVKNGSLKMRLTFDEEVPRSAFMSFSHPDQSRTFGRTMILEKDARYTLEIRDDEAEVWFRMESDGRYAHIFVPPIEDELRVHELHLELRKLIEQTVENGSSGSRSYYEGDSSTDSTRAPSTHAEVLDWENMSCTDYAGEFELFWDKEWNYGAPETEPIRAVRQRLDDLYEEVYGQRLREILTSSFDPVEKLLTTEMSHALGVEELIPVFEELETELSSDVVEERITPRLSNLRTILERRRANEALKLGTFIPAIDLTLIDQQSEPLSSILQDNQIVVLDFWDNYCRPCIRGFIRYRSFYAEFEKLGFEVVSLSFEDDRVDWVERSTELNFPWINAIAPNGDDGEIAKLFGIRYPRANFVLDSEGCILKRDLTPNELRDFLGARLDPAP